MEPKPTAEDTATAILNEISLDRKAAYGRWKAAEKELIDLSKAINVRDDKVVKDLIDAKVNVRLHARKKGKIIEADFAEQKRILDGNLESAQAVFNVAVKRAQDEAAPIQEKIRMAKAKFDEFTEEWESQLRSVEALNLDLLKYWTPENPEPVT